MQQTATEWRDTMRRGGLNPVGLPLGNRQLDGNRNRPPGVKRTKPARFKSKLGNLFRWPKVNRILGRKIS